MRASPLLAARFSLFLATNVQASYQTAPETLSVEMQEVGACGDPGGAARDFVIYEISWYSSRKFVEES